MSPFRKNLAASNFTWLSANARNLNYTNLNTSAMIHSKPQAGNANTVKLGIVGLTIDSNNKGQHAQARCNDQRALELVSAVAHSALLFVC